MTETTLAIGEIAGTAMQGASDSIIGVITDNAPILIGVTVAFVVLAVIRKLVKNMRG